MNRWICGILSIYMFQHRMRHIVESLKKGMEKKSFLQIRKDMKLKMGNYCQNYTADRK